MSAKMENAPVWEGVQLQPIVPYFGYALNKIEEMSCLIDAIKNPSQTKLVFQTLPRHMRRRTMTHNPKRLPRKFRVAHIAQMKKSGLPQKAKRPSRKYRRKPNNLMKEYIRRQMKNIWLETHIWHAKRFHMTTSWGYKLPLAPCGKGFRACYRATSKHCLLQDISYTGCIEITGRFEDIKSYFQKLTSPKCGLSLTAKIYVDGYREGHIETFKANCYPRNAIGKVSFIWKPINLEKNKSIRTVWIFAHASFYEEFMEQLIELFELKKVVQDVKNDDVEEKLDPTACTKTKKEKCRNQFVTKNYVYIRTPKYINDKLDIIVTELKDTLNRFRLTGPLSQAVLSKAFKCKQLNKEKNWFHNFMLNSRNNEAHRNQSEFWKNIEDVTSPSELSPNMVLCLNIEDPRINRPKKRTKAVPENNVEYKFNENVAIIPTFSNESLIWNSEERNNLLNTMMSSQTLCELRNENCLVPGERCDFEEDLQPVPVLLIQRPGSQNPEYKKLGYGSGWDVIVPSGYGISTWICLIMWGARAGGLRETTSICRESGQDEFLPDTISGFKESEVKYQKLKKTYFGKPQNKRLNYTKFAIASPFRSPWKKLVNEWSTEQINDFFVLRDLELLQKIQNAVTKKINIKSINIPTNCLIPIYVKMETRGITGDFSIICIPKKSDLKHNLKNKMKLEHESIYTEPLRIDPNENDRKVKRKEHLRLLKRLRNIRIRRKRKLQETSERPVRIASPGTEKIIDEQYKKMCELWLPENPPTIRNQCTREVFGYISQSDFSFTEGKGTGIGYITSQGLNKLFKICNNTKLRMLVRGTGTRQYRIANFNVRI